MSVDSAQLSALRENFVAVADEVYATSPLYQSWCRAVADDSAALALLTERRAGQQPSYLLFGAAHYVVLSGADHRVVELYARASRGEPVAEDAGAIFLDFVHTYRDAIAELVRTRLVQTNVVRRSVGLRFALAVIAQRWRGPIHLIDVGASAGVHLHVDRFRIGFGAQSVGPDNAALTLRTDLRGRTRVDLHRAPPIASRTGIDLHPVNVTDPDQRRWLRALVWPENRDEAEMLEQALAIVAAHPPRMIAGDAAEVCPRLDHELPNGEARVVFHAATRMHVEPARRPAFDAAIDALAASGSLFHVWHESPSVTHGGSAQSHPRASLYLHGPDTAIVPLAILDGHAAWIEPLL